MGVANWATVWEATAARLRDHWAAGRGHLLTEDTLRMSLITALGDAVNVAARLQDMTKTLGCEVVVSDDVCRTARLLIDAAEEHTVPIRGRAEPMTGGRRLRSMIVESAAEMSQS